MKPTLFLDIDGVINVFPGNGKSVANGKHLRYWDTWEQKWFHDPERSIFDDKGFEKKKMSFIYSPDMLAEILSLREYFDLMWLSTWENTANVVLPELLDNDQFELRYLAKGEGRNEPGTLHMDKKWWKVVALEKEIAANPRPFLWVDDLYSRRIREQVKDIARWNNVPGDILRSYERYGFTKEISGVARQFALSL